MKRLYITFSLLIILINLVYGANLFILSGYSKIPLFQLLSSLYLLVFIAYLNVSNEKMRLWICILLAFIAIIEGGIYFKNLSKISKSSVIGIFNAAYWFYREITSR